MDAKEFCRKIYRETVDNHQGIPPDLKKSLKTHERVPAFIDNLARELFKADSKIKRETLEMAVRDLTLFFVGCVKRQHDERQMSHIARMSIKHKLDKRVELEADLAKLEKESTTREIQNKDGSTTNIQTLNFDGVEA